jgi:polyhydroxyalkanoate synthesis regulator phasin
MDKKQPLDESKNRFAEVIRQSQERRAELNNKTKKKQMEDVELPPRDEEIADVPDSVDLKEDDEPAV